MTTTPKLGSALDVARRALAIAGDQAAALASQRTRMDRLEAEIAGLRAELAAARASHTADTQEEVRC